MSTDNYNSPSCGTNTNSSVTHQRISVVILRKATTRTIQHAKELKLRVEWFGRWRVESFKQFHDSILWGWRRAFEVSVSSTTGGRFKYWKPVFCARIFFGSPQIVFVRVPMTRFLTLRWETTKNHDVRKCDYSATPEEYQSIGCFGLEKLLNTILFRIQDIRT